MAGRVACLGARHRAALPQKRESASGPGTGQQPPVCASVVWRQARGTCSLVWKTDPEGGCSSAWLLGALPGISAPKLGP